MTRQHLTIRDKPSGNLAIGVCTVKSPSSVSPALLTGPLTALRAWLVERDHDAWHPGPAPGETGNGWRPDEWSQDWDVSTREGTNSPYKQHSGRRPGRGYPQRHFIWVLHVLR